MRLGFGLPQTGQAAGPDAVSEVARRAEQLGFSSLWVFDRLLYPVKPQAPYPSGDGSLPELFKKVLDPIETLTFVAGQTNRIAIGSSVLNLPWTIRYCLRGASRRWTSCREGGSAWVSESAGPPTNTRLQACHGKIEAAAPTNL